MSYICGPHATAKSTRANVLISKATSTLAIPKFHSSFARKHPAATDSWSSRPPLSSNSYVYTYVQSRASSSDTDLVIKSSMLTEGMQSRIVEQIYANYTNAYLLSCYYSAIEVLGPNRGTWGANFIFDFSSSFQCLRNILSCEIVQRFAYSSSATLYKALGNVGERQLCHYVGV